MNSLLWIGVPMEFDRHGSLGYQVNHLARLLAAALRDRIAPLGVVPGQFAQLLALYEQDGLTQAQLCARVQVEQPTMARTLARMERDGLVVREPDPADGRRAIVRLTGHARALRPALLAAAGEVNALATAGLAAADVDRLLAAVAAVIGNLDGTRGAAGTRATPAPAGARGTPAAHAGARGTPAPAGTRGTR